MECIQAWLPDRFANQAINAGRPAQHRMRVPRERHGVIGEQVEALLVRFAWLAFTAAHQAAQHQKK